MQIHPSPEYLASQGLSETFLERFWKKIDKNGEVPPHRPELGKCWKWKASTTPWGYGKIFTGVLNKRIIGAHVASWIIHFGPIPDKLFCCHLCDSPPCCRPDHLWLGTTKENAADMVDKGRHKAVHLYGQMAGNCKLTEKKVLEIRRLYAIWKRRLGLGPSLLARRFGVSTGAIESIVSRKSWKHI